MLNKFSVFVVICGYEVCMKKNANRYNTMHIQLIFAQNPHLKEHYYRT